MSVFRGVVIVKVTLLDEYGNKIPGEKRLTTKTYNKPGVAKGQATTVAKRYPPAKVVDRFVEEAVEWRRVE